MISSRRLLPRATVGIVACTLLGTMAACNPPQIAGDPLRATKPGDAFEGTNCSAVRPQSEPDLMAWDSGARANLNRLRRKGVVAVRYEAKGCNVELELLSNCIGPGAYEFAPYSANEHNVAHNTNELFATLPIGASTLSGRLQGNRALRTDYMLAGTHALRPGTTVSASELVGLDCPRATHVIAAVYVGGFAMTAGESRSLDASASLFGASLNGISKADMERVATEGSAGACQAAQTNRKPDDGCAVPLRIGLIPLHKDEASVGGESIAAPAPLASTQHLDADPDVLVAYDAALKADKVGSANPGAAAAAWKKVAATPGLNPYRTLATDRGETWSTFASKARARVAQQSKDDERLKNVLPLESLTIEQKEKVLREYMTMYGRLRAADAVAAVLPLEHRRRLITSLALPLGGIGEKEDARAFYEKCESGTVSACLLLGDRYTSKRLIPKDNVPTTTADATVGEHMLAAAQLFQIACDRGDESGCVRRSETKTPGDEAKREEASKKAFDLALAECEKNPTLAYNACGRGFQRIEREGNAEKTRAARGRVANAAETSCNAGSSNACFLAADHYEKISDTAAIKRVRRKEGDINLAECRAGKPYSCRAATRIFKSEAIADPTAATESYERGVKLSEAECATGSLDACNDVGDFHFQQGKGVKAVAAYQKVCWGPLRNEDEINHRMRACREVALLHINGSGDLPSNPKLAPPFRDRFCSVAKKEDPQFCQ